MIKVFNVKVDDYIMVTEDANFPNGEVSLKIPKDGLIGKVQWFFNENLKTLSHLILVTEFLKSNEVELEELYIPYLPFLRMDRNENTDRLVTGELIFNIIDNLGYDTVKIGDHHSPDNIEYISKLDRNSNWEVYSMVDAIIRDGLNNIDNKLFLYPDKGASARYTFKPVLGYADKIRNYENGNIEAMELHIDKSMIDSSVETTVVIVDDIISKGGTFSWLRDILDKELNPKDFPNISYILVTSHTESKILDGDINKKYSKLLTTDSLISYETLKGYMLDYRVYSSLDLIESLKPTVKLEKK